MKRRNIQMAFVGEGGGPTPEDATAILEGEEAVDLKVTGGFLRLVVPAGTPDRRLFDEASVLGGELVLENGQRFTFEIQEDAEGALYSASARTSRPSRSPTSAPSPTPPPEPREAGEPGQRAPAERTYLAWSGRSSIRFAQRNGSVAIDVPPKLARILPARLLAERRGEDRCRNPPISRPSNRRASAAGSPSTRF